MPTSRSKIRVGITAGDPRGIGPEVVAKALKRKDVARLAHFEIIGEHQSHLTAQLAGKLSLNSLKFAVRLLKDKKIEALVTAPVSKEAISLVEPSFQGHTEFLAQAFGVKNVGMLFVADKLRTIIVTRHIPLNKVSQSINRKNILETITLTHDALVNQFLISHPRIAVCGLNPHAGEGGTIGKEEIEKIIPAIKDARRKRINVDGPFAADTLFTSNKIHHYDAVVAMYHDQGLIPIKALAFQKAVNVTIGLPFIRTSPAHGTAFDIAGKNKADPSSMIEAIKLAVRLAKQ